MYGVNERKLGVIKATNIGHTRDKNGEVRETGPHSYRVEVVPDSNSKPLFFTVTHKREMGVIHLAYVVLKGLIGELKNEHSNRHAKALEIQRPE
jgi:hypothetical protein